MKVKHLLFLTAKQPLVSNFTLLLLDKRLVGVFIMVPLDHTVLCLDEPTDFLLDALNFLHRHLRACWGRRR